MTTVKEKIAKLKEMGFSSAEIIRILESEETNSMEKEQPATDIPRVLKTLGIPVNIKGYEYLKAAIDIIAKRGKIPITKELYPEISKDFGTIPSRVERAIRHAIEVSWDRGDEDKIFEVFGNSVQTERGKPTNSEFIAAVAEYIRNS